MPNVICLRLPLICDKQFESFVLTNGLTFTNKSSIILQLSLSETCKVRLFRVLNIAVLIQNFTKLYIMRKLKLLIENQGVLFCNS